MKFKHERDREMFTFLNPILIMIYADLFTYAKEKHGVELVVTDTISTPERDKLYSRTSKSHVERRSLDIRTKDLNAFVVNDLVDYVNNKDIYARYKYLSRSGDRRLAYFHIGTHQHIHLSLHSRYALPVFSSKK